MTTRSTCDSARRGSTRFETLARLADRRLPAHGELSHVDYWDQHVKFRMA